MRHYRYISTDALARLFLARVESGIGDTPELKEEIEERDWAAKQQWNRIIEDAAKAVALKAALKHSIWV